MQEGDLVQEEALLQEEDLDPREGIVRGKGLVRGTVMMKISHMTGTSEHLMILGSGSLALTRWSAVLGLGWGILGLMRIPGDLSKYTHIYLHEIATLL